MLNVLFAVEDTPKLVGFVVIGNFFPGEDLNWPAWKNKKMPTNDKMIEIKLLGCSRGVGRILFSWALIKCNRLKNRSTIILEVLCGKDNQSAIEFYDSFGFNKEIAYDLTKSRLAQVRFEGRIPYYMSKFRNRNCNFLSRDRLQKLLTYKLISQRHFEFKSITIDKEEEDLMIYCIKYCRFGGSTGGTMICCDQCNRWFHIECVGISQRNLSSIDTYYCPKCTTGSEPLQPEEYDLHQIDWTKDTDSEISWEI